MLKWDKTIIIFLTEDELKEEGIDSSFFQEGGEYAIEIRRLSDGNSLCIHQKLHKFEKKEV